MYVGGYTLRGTHLIHSEYGNPIAMTPQNCGVVLFGEYLRSLMCEVPVFQFARGFS